MLERPVKCLAAVLVLLVSSASFAQTPQSLPVHAPSGSGQMALSVFSAAGGEIAAAACAAPPCSTAALPLGVPPELRGKPVRAQVLMIGEGRRAVVVSIDHGPRAFRAVVAAPFAGTTPKLVFAGLVGLLTGEEGLRSGPMVQVWEPEPDGTRRILVGEEHESVSLCGRPAMLSPRVLHAKDLELKAAKVQRLSGEERRRARSVRAVRVPDDELNLGQGAVLTALSASSAIGAPQALTDGDVETTWAEDVGGSGRGEFVIMRAPPDLDIKGLELTVRPKLRAPERGASPQRFYLASARELYEVTLPEDAWQHPGARYRIPLEPVLRGDCLALVLDTAFDEAPGARVTLAELAVVSEFSPHELPALVGALAGGGQRAEAARSVLVAAGAPAFRAVAEAFGTLDEGGRRVALEVMDQAPCSASAPVYVQALLGASRAQVLHARARLRRCGSDGGAALASALAGARPEMLGPLSMELSLTDPARAASVLAPLLNRQRAPGRRILRSALAQASRQRAAAPALRQALSDASLDDTARIDLLRALGDRARELEPEASRALFQLLGGQPSFRTRYLLLGPAAVLAEHDAEARSQFERMLASDPDPRVRAAALSLVRAPAKQRAPVLRGLGDPDVRVREAAARALATPSASFADAQLVERLREDRWPLVRAAAADALAQQPRGARADDALTGALDDDSPLVRARSMRGLAERRVPGVSGRIRRRLLDAGEWPEVRAEAARALGTLCDGASKAALAEWAEKLANPMASPNEQMIASAAVVALGRLAPPDLKQILAPLFRDTAPTSARRLAASALAPSETCAGKRAR
jgi:hypothetical protein